MKNQKYVAHYRESDQTIQTIREHLEATSLHAKRFAGKIGLDIIGELTGLIHDMGKYSSKYQLYIKSAVNLFLPGDEGYVDADKLKGKIDHSTAGAQWVKNIHKDATKIDKLSGEMIALCVMSHHTGLADIFDISGDDKYSERLNKDFSLTYYDEVRGKIDNSLLEHAVDLAQSEEKTDQLTKIITKIHQLFNDPIRQFNKGLVVRFLFSCLVDADRINAADFETPGNVKFRYLGNYPDWQKLIDLFERKSFEVKNEVDRLRCEISNVCQRRADERQGLFYLTVPTGGGKTFSSLRFALYHAKKYRLDRIIYVIPYTSIIDQNASRVSELFADLPQEIILEHHSNIAPEKDTWRNRILSENWDAPIIFTTTVQFLETLFGSGTRSVRRMHQLAKSIIIFDEIQTLPIKTVHLFNNAINFLTQVCSATVVLCTATQPLLHGVEKSKGAVPYSPDMQIVDFLPLFQKLKRVTVQNCCKPGGWSETELSQRVEDLLKKNGSVLVVVNTKANAKQLYHFCSGFTENTFHLSTDMCPKHRKEILEKIINCLDPFNPRPVICISTSLIEAGVDVDFGAVIRCLAGLDSIAQAAGRCNRNGLREELGIVQIVNLQKENLAKLPEIKIAQEATLRIFDEYQKNPAVFDQDIIGPKAMDQFYKYYFFQRSHEMTYPIARSEIGRDDNMLSLLSTNMESFYSYSRTHDNAKPPYYLWQSFMTACKQFRVIDAPTQGVIVPYDEDAKLIIVRLSAHMTLKEEADLLKKAQQYSVNIFPYMFEELIKKRALFQTYEESGIWHLDGQYYSHDFGVSKEPVSPMDLLMA
jgi:CRISPR-associated endonuclease/helicase Cas3